MLQIIIIKIKMVATKGTTDQWEQCTFYCSFKCTSGSNKVGAVYACIESFTDLMSLISGVWLL